MDNLSVHKTRGVRAAYEELEITPIFNIPYSPQYNGIESYWFLLKQYYKKMILKSMITRSSFDIKRLIENAITKMEQ